VQYEQPRVTARNRGLLRNQLIGKIEVERSDIHYVYVHYAALPTPPIGHLDAFTY
jgi:hypothetical protein